MTAAADVYAVLAVSIHAPVKGATYNRALFTASVKGFNPRTRKGCDLPGLVTRRKAEYVSIHAPVKGATVSPFVTVTGPNGVSIHAPVKGATLFRYCRLLHRRRFQSTHP